jgi:hypothetical protein
MTSAGKQQNEQGNAKKGTHMSLPVTGILQP